MLEDLEERFVIEVSPIVNLEFLVEGLYLLSDLILGGSIHELHFGVADVRGV